MEPLRRGGVRACIVHARVGNPKAFRSANLRSPARQHQLSSAMYIHQSTDPAALESILTRSPHVWRSAGVTRQVSATPLLLPSGNISYFFHRHLSRNIARPPRRSHPSIANCTIYTTSPVRTKLDHSRSDVSPPERP